MFQKRIVLHFPDYLADQPIVYRLVEDYNLRFNILKAYINSEEGGLLVLELSGERADYQQGLKYLEEAGVEFRPLSKDIVRDEKRCTHCSVCIPICPSGAFIVDDTTREVQFKDDLCIACGTCIKICPVCAMEIKI
jgi:ferredoxin